MNAQGITRTAMAAEMEASRAQLNRMLDPEASNMTTPCSFHRIDKSPS